mgnify:CR=1 FL=1
MKITIKKKNLELTDSFDNLINKRFQSVERLMKEMEVKAVEGFEHGKSFSEAFFSVEKETKRHRKGDIFKAEIIISFAGKKLVARSHGENLNSVITKVRDELNREIRRHKTKLIEKPRRDYRKSKKDII